MNNQLPSVILQNAVEALRTLPGVGSRTALRYALNLMRRTQPEVEHFTTAVSRLKTDLKTCRRCCNVSDSDLCPICSSPKRDNTTLCVVENVQDVMAIENTNSYNGLYHVLGGVLSPIDGIRISDLNIAQLLARIPAEPIAEVILALPTTMEGDTTNFYLNKQLAPLHVRVSTLARGVAIGDNLEYADEVTLGQSIVNRIPFSTPN
ncbi:MAG: recombination protein RecR [Bacteroidales bacterium]|nr:recombination protein RecR [Bacteroidales bacterium]